MLVRYASGVCGVAAASCARTAEGVRAVRTNEARRVAGLAIPMILPVKGMYTIELDSPESGIGAFAVTPPRRQSSRTNPPSQADSIRNTFR
jgi:hypothetical protein